jgi:class 3 adenylate cyclase
MPLYMDIHEVDGATEDDLAVAHAADVKIQEKYGVEYHKYWFNKEKGKVFCMCSAPDKESAVAVHQHAHGLLASKIIEVDPDMVEGMMGAAQVNPAGAALIPDTTSGERDPGIRTIMFTDIVGSTAMTQDLGDDAAMLLVNAHDEIVRAALKEARGREIKHTGDGIMASFISAVAAVRCAIRIQQGTRDHAAANPKIPIQVRIGLAAGEPVEQNQDLFGSTVQLAARLCAAAEPSQSLASNALAELCIGKGVQFSDLGDYTLKGFGQPLRVHAIHFG